MNHAMSRGMIVPALCLLLLAAGCATAYQHTKLYSDDPEYLWLEWENAKGQTVAQHFNHPTDLTADQIQQILAAIHLEEHSFFKWRDQGPLFTEESSAKLAGWLAEALQKATADQWVRFAVVSMKRKLLFKDAMLTDGICYFQDGKLNLIFGNIDYQSADPNAEYYRLDPRERTVINALRLQTNPARGYAAPPVVKGDKWLDTDRRNWLVINPAVFFAKPAEAAKPETPVKEDPTLRLQKLKELLDQGLITPEEYEQKRQEILKEI